MVERAGTERIEDVVETAHTADAAAAVAALYEAAIDGSWALALGFIAGLAKATEARLVVERRGRWEVFASSDDLARYLPGDGVERWLPGPNQPCRLVIDEPPSAFGFELARVCNLHVERLLEAARRLAAWRERDQAARAALDRLRVGVVVLDGRGRVLRANRAANGLLRPELGVWIEGECLRASPERHFAVLALIARLGAAGRDRPGRAAEHLELPRQGRPPLRVLAVPVPGDQGSRGELSYALFLSDPDLGVEAPEEVLVRHYGLSEAEGRVISQLLQGLGAEAIAARLGESREAVDERLAEVYRRVGTTRQSELVALVLKGPGGLTW